MTGDSPRELLRLDTIFTETLAADLVEYAAGLGAASLAAAIDGADHSTASDPVTVDYSNVSVTDPAGADDLAIVFDATVAIDDLGLPLIHLETTTTPEGEEALLLGLVGNQTTGGVLTDLSLSGSFELRYEDSLADQGAALRLIGTPTLTVTAAGTNGSVDVPALFGFSDVTIGGSASFDLTWTGDVVDPDGTSGTTLNEWETSLADDLFPVVPIDTVGSDDIAISLDLDSPFITGPVDKTLTWTVPDRTVGGAATAPTLSTGEELDTFANTSPDDALLGLSQMAAALGASQAQTDIRLPFLDARLSDAFSPADVLVTFVQEQSNAAVVCGKTDTDPPTGENLLGTTWYCQAYTNSDPLDPVTNPISWSITNGTLASTAHEDTVGVLPMANAKFTGVTGFPDVTVTWSDDDGTGVATPTSARRRFRHASELRSMLADALFGLGGPGAGEALTTSYDPATDALLFDIAANQDPAPFTTSFVVADALRTGTNLAGVEPTASDNVTVDVGNVSLNLGFGLDLSDDLDAIDGDGADEPRADDRFFLQIDPVAPEYAVAGISVAPPSPASFTGQVGFLDVDVTSSDFTIAKAAAVANLAAVDISADATIGTGVSDSVLLSDVLGDLAGYVTPTHGTTMSATFGVAPSTTLAGFPDGASTPTIAVSWPIVTPASAPAVTPDATTYVPVLRPFDVTPTIRGINTAAGNGFGVADTGQDFSTAFGFAASAGDTLQGVTLVNLTSGGSCTGVEIATVAASLGIQCAGANATDTGLAGGIALDTDGTPLLDTNGEGVPDNDWSNGDLYEVRGSEATLAFIALEALYDLANRLDNSGGEFDAKLPLVGLSPHDFVPQFSAVRAAVATVTTDLATTGAAGTPGTGTVVGAPPQNLADLVTAIDLAIARELDPGATDGLGLVSLVYESAVITPANSSAVPHLGLNIGPVPTTGDNATDDVRIRVALPDGNVATPDLDLVADGGEASDLLVTWDSAVQLDIALPLNIDVRPGAVLVRGTTGVTSASLTADGTALDLTGSFGALDLTLGTSNQLTGVHEAYTGTASADAATTASGTANHSVAGTSTAGTTNSLSHTGAFGGVPSGGTLSAGGDTCTVASVTVDTLTCSANATPGAFAAGEAYTYSWTLATILHTSDSLAGVLVGDVLTNTTDSGSCRISAVDTGTITCAAALNTGDWSNGDTWAVTSARTLTDAAAAPALSAIADIVGSTLTHVDSGATCTVSSVAAITVTCGGPLTNGAGDLVTVVSGDAYSLAVTSTTTLHEDGTAFDTFGFATGAGGDAATNTTDSATCTIGATATSQLTCLAALSGGSAWNVGDEYLLPGVGVARLDAGFSMTGGSTDKLLDSATDPYVETLTGVLTGTDNDCGAGLVGDLCLRISVGSPGSPPDFLGTVSYATDLDAAAAMATLPAALSNAKAAEPLDLALLTEAVFFLEGLIDDALDGNRSGEAVPLLGADLGAGSDVPLDALAVYDAIKNVGSASAAVTDPDQLDEAIANALTTALATLNGPTVAVAPVVTVDCGGTCAGKQMKDVDDVTINFTIGRNLGGGTSVDQGCTTCGAEQVTPAPTFDLGLPGLDASGSGELAAKVGYTLAVEFGLSRADGPYLGTTTAGELEVGANATILGPGGGTCAPRPEDHGIATGSTTTPVAQPSTFSADRCFEGRVGLFPVTFYDGDQPAAATPVDWVVQHNASSHVDILTTVDLIEGFTTGKLDMGDLLEGIDAGVSVAAEGNIDLHFLADIGDAGTPLLPSVQGTLNVVHDTAASTDAPWPQIEYRNLVLDIGSFFDGFLGPIAGDVAEYVKPFIPVVDMITAPIPVISDVAKLVGQPPVTLLSLMEGVSGNDLSLIRNLASFLKLVVALGTIAQTGVIGLGPATPAAGAPPVTVTGGFKVDTLVASTGPCGKDIAGSKLKQPKTCTKSTNSVSGGSGTATATNKKQWVKPLGDCPAAGCSGKEAARTISRTASVGITGGGVSFPFLNSTAEIYGMILGSDATLVRVDLGTITATAGLSVSWGPFMAGPLPVEISIAGSVSLSGRFAVGFDTRGIRAAIAQGTPGGLIEGVYIDDLDASGVDVPEIKLVTTFTLGASVSVKIIKVGLEGGVTMTIELNLNDPNKDGKLRIEEIRSFGSDPLCLFEAKGMLAFFVNVFVELDLGFWSKKWSYTIWKLAPPLVLFDVKCDPPVPVLAKSLNSAEGGGAAGDVLLNMGSSTRRTARAYESEEINERFIVRQLEAVGASTDCPHAWSTCTKISVSAFGLYQEFKVKAIGSGAGATSSKVVARADDGTDTLLVQSFVADDGTEQPFVIPTDLDGGTGNDRLEGGEGPDTLRGGPDVSAVDDRDTLKGDRGNDTLFGGADNDKLDGAIGDDTLDGGPGDDRVNGGPGADLLKGGDNADTIIGGPGLDTALSLLVAGKRFPNDAVQATALAIELEDVGDVIIGGPGDDDLQGHHGNDLIFGDDADDGAGGTFSDAALKAGLNATQVAAACSATGNGGRDRLEGERDNDTLIGGGDDDQMTGSLGSDTLCGNDGDDLLEGDPTTEGVAPGDDTLDGGAGDDRLYGRVGDDTIDGGSGGDLVDGGDGEDVIEGGTGPDLLLGLAGNDIVIGDSATVSGPLSPTATTGTDAIAKVSALGGTDDGSVTACATSVIIKNGTLDVDGDGDVDVDDDGWVAGVPVIDGKVDLFTNGDIADASDPPEETDSGSLAGHIVLAGAFDLDGDGVVESNGEDDGAIRAPTLKADENADCIFGGAGNDGLWGVGGSDRMSGDTGHDHVDGGEGADQLRGALGDDNVRGGDGGDTMYGDSGTDAMMGDAGNDTMFGGLDADHMEGNSGADMVQGDAGDDYMIGGSSVAASTDGNVDLGAGPVGDTLRGSSGADIIAGDNATITPGGVVTLHDRPGSAAPTGTAFGDDIIDGGRGGDLIYGQSGNDTIHGDEAELAPALGSPDVIVGNAGADLIWGDGGSDDIVGGSTLAGEHDGNVAGVGDTMFGGTGEDVMLGDNGTINPTTRAFTRFDDATTNDAEDNAVSGDDTMYGDEDSDILIGQGGDDTMFGDDQTPGESMLQPLADADYMEGNAGADTMYGHAGNDVMLGGSSTAGVVDENIGGVGDSMAGGSGADTMAGDNASLPFDGSTAPIQLYDVATTSIPRAPQTSGDDTMNGDGAADLLFGQGGEDTMSGGLGNDYMEGNDGQDTMSGEDGDDDMIGGGSANDGDGIGTIDGNRAGIGLLDVGEIDMYGGDGVDWMTGDNARIDRNFKPAPAAPVDMITLFDVETVTTGASPGTGGGDRMHGDELGDRMFGQTGNDDMFGGGGDDYMEGDNGRDTMLGEDGDDDMIGGGSANDEPTAPGTGRIDADRTGDELLDAGELVVRGGLGQDWITGDNAVIDRNIPSSAPAEIVLFDVETDPGPGVDDGTSGGDILFGNEDSDRIFGQGNGAQPDSQSDPDDLIDNDGDGVVDEDGASWLGDVIFGDGTAEAATDGDDYVEGNHGADLISGAGGQDDLIGGGSAADGVITPLTRVGDGLVDGRDTIHAGSDVDFVAGDNARIDRGGNLTRLTLGTDRSVQLFDLNSTVAPTSGGDYLAGNEGADVMFGQGNGAQDSSQADPDDGVDNDHDGTESGDPGSYDCEDGVDNDNDSFTDGDDPDCQAAIDEDVADWAGDIILGGTGDEYMEGNHGSDWMRGNAGEDDMVGGGSSASGAIVPVRDGRGLNDGHDTMYGNDEDDVMTGDNATINRNRVSNDWERLTGAAGFDLVVRVTEMPNSPAEASGAYGDDYLSGDDGDDEMYGQLGDDFMLAGNGDDAVIGDLGQVTTNLLGDGINDPALDQLLEPNAPFFSETVYESGTLFRETVLFDANVDDGGQGGADRIFGHDGRDWLHGGPGPDIINGDGDGILVPSVDDPAIILVEDPDPTTIDEDAIFGGDDDDVIWGGRGDDRAFGGHGADYLDVRPRVAVAIEGVTLPADPPEWFTYGEGENYQGLDFLYGGWDQDAMQANVAGPGPAVGDRLVDWAGAYNAYYVCSSNYGEYVITRAPSPSIRSFLQELVAALGADDPGTSGASGFRELGLVFPNQNGANSNPIHPDHPGHFTCEPDSNNTAPGGNEAPDATITSPVAPVTITEGDTVDLVADASDPEGGGVDYLWSFGDPAIPDSTLPGPSVVFAAAGTYTVTLTVTDSEGLAGPTPATLEIVVDPSGLPTVTAAATDPDADESGGTGTFTVSRTGDTTSALTVNFATSGSATAGDDYVDDLGTSVTIAIGDLDATVTVTPVDDLDSEGPETVNLSIDPDQTYTVGGADTATVTIADDEAVPPTMYRAITESTGDGTVTSGDLTSTIGSDDVVEAIRENNQAKRSKLSHTWTFDLTTAGTAVLTIEASEDSTVEDFDVEVSTDGTTWTTVLTISGSTDTVQTAALSVGSGTVYVRVTDTDRTRTETVRDTISIDDLFIEVTP